MQLLYIAAVASICVLFGTVWSVMRNVREDDSEETMEAETALSFMAAPEQEPASTESWREGAAALQIQEPEVLETETVPEPWMPSLQPIFAQGFVPDAPQREPRGLHETKRSKPPAYAVVLQGMVVGAAIVLLTHTQRRFVG